MFVKADGDSAAKGLRKKYRGKRSGRYFGIIYSLAIANVLKNRKDLQIFLFHLQLSGLSITGGTTD